MDNKDIEIDENGNERLKPGSYEESIAFEIKKQILDELNIKLDDLVEEAIKRKKNKDKDLLSEIDNLYIFSGAGKYKSPTFNPNKLHVVKNNLKEYIKKSPYSQTKLANMAGISDKTLSNIVNNKFNTSLEVSLKLCAILGVRVEDVFYLKELDVTDLLDEETEK